MSDLTEYDELADLGDALKAEKDKVAALEAKLSKMEPWWNRMSNEDVAAELSATFDLNLDVTRQIADWILAGGNDERV